MDAFYERKICTSMHERSQVSSAFELKQLDASGIFAGYASVFDVVDSQHDVIERGAFAQSIKGRAQDIKLLWQHALDEPIGIIEELREDKHGLYVKGRLLMDVAKAREAYSLIKSGVVKGLSIGYSPKRYRINNTTGVRHIAEVALWEISLVTFPANDAAQITVIKSTLPDMQPLMQALDAALIALK
jgi:uncharacterized protein